MHHYKHRGSKDKMKKTRLDILCELHNQQGGTIHEFNTMYNMDFLNMSEDAFYIFVQVLNIDYFSINTRLNERN